MPTTTTDRRSAAKRPLDHDPTRVRDRRIERGLTQRAAAIAAGISPGHLCEIERGNRNPSPTVLARLAGALGTTIADLRPRPRDRRAAA